MIDLFATLAQGLFSAVSMFLLASWLCALLYPAYQRLSPQLSLTSQALLTLAYVMIAPLSAILAVVVLSQPAIAAIVVYEHCHGAECVAHAPAPIFDSFTGASLIAAVSVLVILLIVLLTRRLHRAYHQQLSLAAIASEANSSPSLPYKVIESPDLLAWCAGWLFPRVYLSRGLLNQLNASELTAVLAHEHGHCLRRDNLRKLVISWASLGWPPFWRTKLLDDYSRLSEQLADQYSTTVSGQAELLNNIYARLQNGTGKHYRHRLQPGGKQTVSQGVTGLVCGLLALWFVCLTSTLTIVAHILLEKL